MFNETKRNKIIATLHNMEEDSKQVAREIYYALSFIDNLNPARANLMQALKLLGVNEPKDVGLSNKVLDWNNKISYPRFLKEE